MFRVVIHFIAFWCLATGLPSLVLAAEQHNTGAATTDQEKTPPLKDRVSDMAKDPTAADPDKLNKMSAELDKHEKEETMTKEEIKELRDEIDKIRQAQVDKTGDTTTTADKGKDGGTGSKSGPSGMPITDSASPATTGISGSTGTRTGLSGGDLSSSPWGEFATKIWTQLKPLADTAAKLMPQTTPAAQPGTFTPQTVQSSANIEPRPTLAPQGGSGSVSGTGSNVSSGSTNTSQGFSAPIVVSSAATTATGFTETSKFFSESIGPAASSDAVVVNEMTRGAESVSRPVATAMPMPSSTTTAQASVPATTTTTSATSTPNAVVDTRSTGSVVRTATSLNKVEVTKDFALSDSPISTSPVSTSTTSEPLVIAKASTFSSDVVTPRNTGTTGEAVYRNGVQGSSTQTDTDTVVNRITSQYAVGKGIDPAEEQRPVAQTFFARSTESLDQLTTRKAVNAPEIDASLTRKVNESGLKGGTSLATLTGKAVASAVSGTAETVIRGALGIISSPK